MLDKTRGYWKDRPPFQVDSNVDIMAGMVAFLATNAAGVTVATTAASGDVPIGTFWKDRSSSAIRCTVETGAFNANNLISLSKGNVTATGAIQVTNAAGTTTYVQGTDYTVSLTNGTLTRLATGSIPALGTVLVTYRYSLVVGQEDWDNVSTRWSLGVNYDRQPNDTIGSGRITVITGDATLYTDQYDPTQTYTLNAQLRSNASSLWSTAGAGTGMSSVCGRVRSVPTAADPFLGVDQIRVTA